MGGRGTRLQPLTDTRPKPMLPIVDVPFLEHQLANLARHGVTDVTFACGFLPQQIVGHFGEGQRVGMRLHYVVEPEPLDTGGAIGFAARTIDVEGPILVGNGDVLTGLDIGALLEAHRRKGAVGTIALTPVDDPSRYGLVRTGDEGEVRAFLEKPAPEEIDTNLINAGTYVLERSVLDRIPREGRCNIEREIFPALVGLGLYAHVSDAYWKDIGTFPSYLDANLDMLRGLVSGAGSFGGDVSPAMQEVHADATVSSDAEVHGPCYIGPGATIGAGATIGPAAVIAAGAVVEAGARVTRSVVLEEATVCREAQVVDSIVAEGATIGPRASVSDGAVVGPSATVAQPVLRGVVVAGA